MLLRLILAISLLLPGISLAKDTKYELTPYAGWRTSSSLEEEATGATINLDETVSYGLILSVKKDGKTNYDLLFSKQDTDLRLTTGQSEGLSISYVHLGGTVFYEADNLRPFVSGGLGATHISPSNSAFSSETKFSFSVGGGVMVPFQERVALRLEARGYGTVVDSSGSILCSGGCVAHFTGSLFWQVEALAGISFAF